MTVDSSIVKYIRDQKSAGYEDGQIAQALRQQGWAEDEIGEAFGMAGRAARPEPARVQPKPAVKPQSVVKDPVKEKVAQLGERKTPSGGFGVASILPLAGGILIIINSVMIFMGLGDILGMILPGMNLTFLDMLGINLAVMETFMICLVVGVGIVMCSVLGSMKPEQGMLSGIVIIALSVMALLVGNGFLLGSVISMAGGAMLALE